MRNYVITILTNTKSCAVADRCVKSAKTIANIAVEKWPATTPKNDVKAILKQEEINPNNFNEKFSRTENAIAAFLSHFSLWKHCVETNQEIMILEHDAVFVNGLPNVINHRGCISLGHPSYGVFNKPEVLGVNPLQSKTYFPGAHAYIMKPEAAKIIIEVAKQQAGPTDVFLHSRRFPFLEEYYPWPVEAIDSFTTIQNVAGCKAKHNYKQGYRIINA